MVEDRRLRGGTFAETTSAIRSRLGEPDFVFQMFDHVNEHTRSIGKALCEAWLGKDLRLC